MKSVFDPQAPLNQGSFRPIEVITPPGTIVNVQRPAPAGSHGEIRKRVIATMVGALAQLVPDKVAGDLCRTSFHNLIGGYDARAGASGCTTNGRPAATARSPRTTGRAPWRPSIGATSSPCSPPR